MKGCIDKMVVSAKHALCYVALHCQEVGRVALVKMNGVISTVKGALYFIPPGSKLDEH